MTTIQIAMILDERPELLAKFIKLFQMVDSYCEASKGAKNAISKTYWNKVIDARQAIKEELEK